MTDNRKEQVNANSNSGAFSIKRYFLFATGVSPSIFQLEETKYYTLGAIMLFTAFTALATGAYAILSISKNILIAFSVGVLWAFFIYFLNRFILASYEDLDTFSKIFHLFLRLAFGVFVALAISHPFKLLLFDPEISDHLRQEHETIIAEKLQKKVDTEEEKRDRQRKEAMQNKEDFRASLKSQVLRLEGNIDNERNILDDLRNRVNTAEKIQRAYAEELRCEKAGTCGSLKPGQGSVYGEVERKYTDAVADAERARARLNYHINRLEVFERNHDKLNLEYREFIVVPIDRDSSLDAGDAESTSPPSSNPDEETPPTLDYVDSFLVRSHRKWGQVLYSSITKLCLEPCPDPSASIFPATSIR